LSNVGVVNAERLLTHGERALQESGSASAKRPLDRRPSCVEPPPAQSLWYLHLQSTIWLP